jgi:hypothetical protein
MIKKKKTVGSNPLEAYLAATSSVKKTSPLAEPLIAEQLNEKKQRITIHLTVDLIEKMKNVVFWEPGMTLTAFAQEALEKAVHQLEKKRGESYPERKNRSLKGGRPLA